MSDGAEILKVSSSPVIPAEVHGFAVRVGVGPYPENAPGSHRRAMYAELLPVSLKARTAMAYMGRVRILATTPLTPQAASAIAADPDSRLAEMVATATLANASRLAREAVGARRSTQ